VAGVRLLAAAVTATTLLAVTSLAFGAPNRTTTLAAGSEYKWDGGPMSGSYLDSATFPGCTPSIAECDDTLLKVDAAGTLTVKIGDPSSTTVDLDLFLYMSDASGKEGKQLKEGVTAEPAETVTAEVDPGYYLARVRAANAQQGTYKGSAKLAASADSGEPAPITPPTTTPAAANAAPTTAITSPKGKRITAIKGTASDDGGVAKVAVGLVQIKGKKCYGLTASGSFKALKKCTAPVLLPAKGTTAWTLKLKKPLKKGKYVAYALATDDKGVAEGGFGAKNRVAFKVK